MDNKSNSFFWGIYDDICAVVGIIMFVLAILALLHGLNNFESEGFFAFAPLVIVVLPVPPI